MEGFAFLVQWGRNHLEPGWFFKAFFAEDNGYLLLTKQAVCFAKVIKT